jgi:flagellar hook-basal body complex protein FliE
MKQAWAVIWLGLFLLFSASAVCRAADNSSVKQLEAMGDYEAAIGTTVAQSPTAVIDTYSQADKLAHEFRMRQEDDKLYEVIILSALALVSLFIVLRFITAKATYSASHIVSATGLIFIIFGTILLVIMADTEQQLTAAIGILGAVAGYLFGSIHRGKSDTETGEEK